MNRGRRPVRQNSGDSPLISIICRHRRNTSTDKICHSWSGFWHMMSKMLCVSSCSTVSDCVFRVLQVTACSATYIMLGWSIQVFLKMSSLYMIVIQPMQQTLLVKFGGIGGEKYKKHPTFLLTFVHMTMIWITNWSSCCMGNYLQTERTF